ncbi:MAG: AzlC family ABC transporter permease [Ruminococcaceae bacterium]|nr:AzlC family ABC transporter permease [Oscillospiraceae bacterium]
MNKPFITGIRDGIPIALGYLSVSFGFGILAASLGLSPLEAFLVSATNLTSAGQVAGIEVIAAGGTLWEMAVTQLVINIRYFLMALSLSQKLDGSFHTPQRLLAAYGITDEIFGVSHSKEGKLTPLYLYGLIVIAFLGWTSGTLLGALAGDVLPKVLTDSMGIMLYGMFLAVILPEARKSRGALAVIVIAAVISILFRYVLTAVSGGFAIILSAVAAAALVALLFPVDEKEA